MPILGYLLGSIPTGFLVVRWMRGRDVRDVGSGRTGGTNVLRAAGWKAALIVIIVDVLKSTLAVTIARWLGDEPIVPALAGATAVLGHNYSLFLNFRGGAGAMTTIGGAIGLWPWSVAILIPLGLMTVVVTRYASLGSTMVALLTPTIFAVRAILGLGPWEYVVYGVLVCGIILWSLRPNMQRLLKGQERRVNLKKIGRERSG
jgi:glycerol-3-phosphate acyltransferase PlsY